MSDARQETLFRLNEKIRSLRKAQDALVARERGASPEEQLLIESELSDVRNELSDADARYDEVDDDSVLPWGSDDLRAELMDAIDRVNRAITTSAAVSDLIAATTRLINAYKKP